MSLEDILRQKAVAKEAERLRQEQEQKIAADEAERLQKQKAEEARLLGLRQSVADIDAKIGEWRSLLTGLKEAHEQTGASVAGAKKQGEELTKATASVNKLFTNEEFRALLAEEGIESVEDLLEAEEYSEQEEVKSVKELRQARAEKRQAAREQIQIRGQAKSEAHKAVTAEAPAVPRRRTYRDITTDLEDRVRELESERKIVFYQTPEGQEAFEAEIFERVKQRHEKFLYHDRRFIKQEIYNYQTVLDADIKDVQEYGEERVKAAIKDYYGHIIDSKLAEEVKSKGFLQLQEGVETIENLPKRWEEVREDLKKVEWARRETIGRLAEITGNDGKAPLFQALNHYGRYGLNDPQKLAEAFIDSQAEYNSSTLGLGIGPTKIPEAIAEKIISEQEALFRGMKGGIRSAFPRNDISNDISMEARGSNWERHRYETKLYNPERMAIILSEQAEFYKKFQVALTTPEEVFVKVQGGSLSGEIKIKSSHDLKLDETKQFIEFDAKTYSALRDNNIGNIKYQLEQEQKEREKTTALLKEQIRDKVEVDWFLKEMHLFRQNQENSQVIQEVERIIKTQKIVEDLFSRLDAAADELKKYINEKVSFNQDRVLEFNSVPRNELSRLYREISELQKKIDKTKTDISLINRRAYEGDGWFGGKRKKREKEIADLEIKEKAAKERLQELQTEYKPKNEMDEKLNAVRSLLHHATEKSLNIAPPRESVSLQEFMDTFKKQMNFQLTSEQSQIYEQHQTLKKKQEQTAKQYDKKWRW